MLVSVITSVYNCQDYVSQMLDSILNQTFHDWECIIIDDASTDNTWDVIKRYRDDRIILIQNEKNEGLTKNLNKGIARAQGKYIIRMDGDDIACPERFEKQIRFMENNPQIAVSGCNIQRFGKRYSVSRVLLSDDELRVNMLFNTVMNHPTFIIRKSVLNKYNIRYDEQIRYAQDYNLLYQLMQYGGLANIPDILVKYRVHDGQVTLSKGVCQRECADITRNRMLKLLDIELSVEEQECWFKWCVNKLYDCTAHEKRMILSIHERIVNRNKETGVFDQDILQKTLNKKLKDLSEGNRNNVPEVRDKYFTLFLMMNQWVRIKQAGDNVAGYLDKKGYKKIAIYGMGYVGETLFAELQNTGIKVAYSIDKEVAYSSDDIRIVAPDDDLKPVDAIVVTAVTYFDDIKANLCRKISCPIISLIDIVFGI